MKAQYFATIQNGQVAMVASAIPEHTLLKNQIAITKLEFEIVRALHLSNINERIAMRTLQGLQKKVKAAILSKPKRSKK